MWNHEFHLSTTKSCYYIKSKENQNKGKHTNLEIKKTADGRVMSFEASSDSCKRWLGRLRGNSNDSSKVASWRHGDGGH